MKSISILVFLFLSFTGFNKVNNSLLPAGDTTMYFPPDSGNEWETIPISELGWNQSAIQPLKDFLEKKHTKSFMILVNGRIVMEEYFNGQKASSDWEWNSAGKTLVSASVGIAQQEGLLNINKKVSDYLGTGWTSMPAEKENLVTVRNLLTMTSGLDDRKQIVRKANLSYVADAGTRWAYSNDFQKLIDVVSRASNKTFQHYFTEKIKNKIGMDGYWRKGIIFTIYHSTARSMARFGLLALNNGKWKKEQILNESFFRESISSSQNINPSYGYLWWLNGKSKYMIPGQQTVFKGFLVPDAPADMYAAMGAMDQRIYVIPGKKMVVVRMGESSNPTLRSFAVSGFDKALFEKINAVIN